MTEVELLKAARAKVEQGWCQRWYAIDKQGLPTYYISEKRACAWCMAGALIVAGSEDDVDNSVRNNARRRIERRILPKTVAEYNDTPGRTQEEVLSLFDTAIADAEAGVWIS